MLYSFFIKVARFLTNTGLRLTRFPLVMRLYKFLYQALLPKERIILVPVQEHKMYVDIGDMGEEVVPALIDAISRHADEQDADYKNYIANCIMVLGSLAPEESVDVLLKAFESRSAQVSYQAARVLGDVWAPVFQDAWFTDSEGTYLARAPPRTCRARTFASPYRTRAPG